MSRNWVWPRESEVELCDGQEIYQHRSHNVCNRAYFDVPSSTCSTKQLPRVGSGPSKKKKKTALHQGPWGGTTTGAAPGVGGGHGRRAGLVCQWHLQQFKHSLAEEKFKALLAQGERRGQMRRDRAQRGQGIGWLQKGGGA